jgi:type I restriction enzyme S subunit
MIAASNHSTWESLPSGWAYDRMKDVVDLRDEKVFVESEETNYLELEDLEGGSGRILSRRDTLTVESAVTRFAKGDVLFGKLRPYLEKYARPDFDGFCTGEILAFHPRRIDGHYLFYHMGSDWLIQRCNALAYGAKMPRVNWPKQLALFDLPLPPLAEQKRIAAYLDASCAAIDRAVETKRKQLETLDALRKSIIQKAVTQGLNPKVKMKDSGVEWLGPVPAHWRARRIKDIVDARSGEGITSYEIEPEGDYPVYGGNGLRGYTNSYTHEGDFVLIGRQGALCGNINYASGKFFASEHAVVCRPYQTLQTEWFGAVLDAMNLNQYSNSAAQPGLSVARIKRLMIPIPPVAERLEIERHLFDSSLAINKLTENITAQLTTLTAYRKSLIHECVTGKRRISDADVAKVEAHG